MLAPSMIAGLFHLAQLRHEARMLRLGPSSLALEVRLTRGQLVGRCLQRGIVSLLRILQNLKLLPDTLPPRLADYMHKPLKISRGEKVGEVMLAADLS